MKKIFLILFFPFAVKAQVFNVRILTTSDGWSNPLFNSWLIPNIPQVNDTSQALVDILGNTLKIRAVLSSSDYTFDNGVGYLAGKTEIPDSAIRYGSYSNQRPRTLSLIGLDDSSKYTITLYATRQRTDTQKTTFSVDSISTTVLTDTNTSRFPVFANIRPKSGRIDIKMTNTGGVYSYLNAFQVQVIPKIRPQAVLWVDSTVITYPNSVVRMTANGSLRATPAIRQWYQTAGLPAIFTGTPSDTVFVSGLRPGNYRFGVIVQDTLGNMDSTAVAITVRPFLCPICPICPPPVVCPVCPVCPAPRTVTGVNWAIDPTTGKFTLKFTYSDGNP